MKAFRFTQNLQRQSNLARRGSGYRVVPFQPSSCSLSSWRTDDRNFSRRNTSLKSINTNTNRHDNINDPMNKILQSHPGSLSEESMREAMDEVAYQVFESNSKNNADQALRLLDRLVQEEASQKPNVIKQGMVFNVLKACSRKPILSESLERLDSLLEALRRTPHLWNDNMGSYFLSAMVHCKDNKNASERAEVLLHELQESHDRDKHRHIQPSGRNYAQVVTAHAYNSQAKSAERLLWKLMDLNESNAFPEKFLEAKLCNQVINALANSSEPDSTERAQALLDRMVSMNHNGHYQVKPDVITYTTLLLCYCNSSKIKEAEHLLWQMFELNQAGYLRNGPNTRSFSVVMNALAKSNDADALPRAQALLEKIERNYAGKKGAQVNVILYNCLLNCFSRSGMAKEAEDLIHRMHGLRDAGMLRDGPNFISYTCMLGSLSRRSEGGASADAKAWYQKMIKLHESGYPNMKPDVVTFTALLQCFASEGEAKEAENTLQRMQILSDNGELPDGPNAISYGCVIDALGRCGDFDAPKRAESTFNTMLEKGIQPSVVTYTQLLNCYAAEGMAEEAEALLQRMYQLHDEGIIDNAPSSISYGCVLDALARSGNTDAPNRAEALLDDMHRRSAEGDVSLVPDEIQYNIVLSCYADHGRATASLALLEQMHELHRSGILKNGPSATSYNYVILALGNSGESDAPEQARELFDSMADNSDIGSTFSAYNTLLACYARCGRYREAGELLNEMITLYDSGDLSDRPDIKSFNQLLDSLTRSKASNTPELAVDILKTIKELHNAGYDNVEPDETTKSIFLRCYGSFNKFEEGKQHLKRILGTW